MATEYDFLRLPEECVKDIFKHCTVSSLINLSETCSYLKEIVYAVFATKLRTCTVSLKCLTDLQIRKVFRLFGNLFTSIDSEQFQQTEESYYFEMRFLNGLVRYCANITDLTFFQFSMSSDEIDLIQIHYPRIRSLQFKECYFENWVTHHILTASSDQLEKFVLQCGGINPENSIRNFAIQRHFPQLLHVSFRNAFIANMIQFFQMNPQITNYEEENCDNLKIQNIIQWLPNIHSLKLIFGHGGSVNVENIFRLEYLHSFEMSSLFPNTIISTTIQSNSLQHLHLDSIHVGNSNTGITRLINLQTLRIIDCTISLRYIVDICIHCPLLTSLHVAKSCFDFPSNNQLFEIVRHAVNLEKFHIDCVFVTERISEQTFMRIVHIVRNRLKKLFISLNDGGGTHTLTDRNVELKYSFYNR